LEIKLLNEFGKDKSYSNHRNFLLYFLEGHKDKRENKIQTISRVLERGGPRLIISVLLKN
jgi:hypothetical protein